MCEILARCWRRYDAAPALAAAALARARQSAGERGVACMAGQTGRALRSAIAMPFATDFFAERLSKRGGKKVRSCGRLANSSIVRDKLVVSQRCDVVASRLVAGS